MKKILTLLIAASAFTSAFAQDSREDARRVILGGGNKRDSRTTDRDNGRDVILGNGDRRVYGESGERYPNSSRSSESERISREYDRKIESIRNNRQLSYEEKQRIIRQLENERNRKIRAIDEDYSRRYERDRYEDDDDRNYKKGNKKYKSNNGNRYGLEKGKGNPHRRS